MHQKLGIREFTEVFYDNIDTFNITSTIHIEENENFYDDIVIKLFDFYQRSNLDLQIRDLVLPFHIFLHSMFTNKPNVYKEDNVIKIL